MPPDFKYFQKTHWIATITDLPQLLQRRKSAREAGLRREKVWLFAVPDVCDLSSREAEVGGLGVRPSRGYMDRPCLKTR